MSPKLKLPWKIRVLLSTLSFAMNISRRSDGTVNRRLINLFGIKSSPSETPINGVKSFDITVDSSCNLWFRLYTPAPAPTTTETSLPIIIYFHGGGFAFMAANSKTYDEFCQKLAREIPSIVISVNYRLSPEHKYPCQYEDGFDVLKFIDEAKFEEFPQNANMKHCFLAGDSAGANLAHHVALKACDYKFLQLQVIGIISLQPFFGGEERTESETKLVGTPPISVELTDWMWKAFLPEGSDRDHAAANVFRSNSVDISGMKFPATIMFVGGFDPLQDWQKKYYEWLKRSGKEVYLIEYPNAFHTFYLFPELPESSLMIKEVKEFMQKQSCN